MSTSLEPMQAVLDQALRYEPPLRPGKSRYRHVGGGAGTAAVPGQADHSPSCMVSECRGALSREREDALW
jgi:hypothetical protein